MKKSVVDKSIWLLYFVFLFIMLYRVASTLLTGTDPQVYLPFLYLSLILPYIVVVLHSYKILGLKKTIMFHALAGVIGYITEYIGIHYGYIFGGIYSYNPVFISLFKVPVMVPFMWGAFAYIGYIFTDSFFVWGGQKMPLLNKKPLLLSFVVLLNALIITSMDVFLDPIQVHHKHWAWNTPGIFFGTPLGNFFGWLATSALIVCLFRLYEMYDPRRPKKVSNSLYVIGVLGYATFSLTYIILGGLFGMNILYVLGVLPALLIVYNLLLFLHRKTVKIYR